MAIGRHGADPTAAAEVLCAGRDTPTQTEAVLAEQLASSDGRAEARKTAVAIMKKVVPELYQVLVEAGEAEE